MSQESPTRRPRLVFSWGNPSRGDDALGPQMTAELARLDMPEVELLTDFQLQIEHCLDLQLRRQIFLVDASLQASEPFEVRKIEAQRDASFTSHAMSPQALLAACQASGLENIPGIYLLEIRGYEFGLGQPVSPQASDNFNLAKQWLTSKLHEEYK